MSLLPALHHIDVLKTDVVGLETVALYRSYFGPDWTGRFVFGLQSVDTLIPWVGYAPDMYEKLEETVRNNPQWGVDYANT